MAERIDQSRRIGLKAGGWVGVSVPGLPWRVELLVELVDGWPEVIGLKLEPDIDAEGRLRAPWRVRDIVINTTSLRGLPLRRLREAAFELRRMRLKEAHGATQPALRRPGQPLAPGHLGEVADIYRAAVDGGKPPLPAIAGRWRVKRPTASRWVRAARDQGLLGWPERRGVAGVKASTSPIDRRSAPPKYT